MIDPTTIRHYLLGELTQEEQRARVEERLLTDDDFFQEFELAKDDLIGEYVNNKLSPQERENFEQNFLTTEERRESLRQARALARYAEKTVPAAVQPTERKVVDKRDTRRRSWWMWFQPAPGWALAASLVVIVGLSFAAWRMFFYRSDVEQGLVALNAAYRRERPVAARLSGLEYAPRPNTRGRDQSKVDLVSRDRAQRYLLDAENDDPGPAADHALGLFYLTELKFDQAIQHLKKALEADANNAQLHSDLGAALLEKAKQDRLNGEEGKSLEGFAESLEHLNRALELNGSLLDALFNRALCREFLSPPQAADDWRKYLEKDSQSPWADEARQHLKEIESQRSKLSHQKNEEILAGFLNAFSNRDEETAWRLLCWNRDVTGGFLRNKLLDEYLDHDLNGRTDEAQRSFEAISYAADLESKRSSDRFLIDQVRFYQNATRSQRASAAEARQLMSAGHKGLQGHEREKAVNLYSKAKAIFDSLGDNGQSLSARYAMAHAYLLLLDSERGLITFQEVVREAEAREYRWLLAQSLSGMANAQTGLDDYSASLENSHRAQQISEAIGDIRGITKAADQLSLVYTRLGNYRKAIESQNRALTLAREHYVDPMQAWRSNFLMATPLHLLGWRAAAEVFQKESLRMAQETGQPYYICRSHIGLGVIYGSQGKYEEATRNVRLAFDLATKIPSEATRADTVAYSSLQLGHLYRQAGDFSKAMASYDEVLKIYNSDYPAFLYAAHKGKLLSCIAQGGCPTVSQDIEATVNLFENYRSKILEEENKFVFFDTEQNVYDAVIDYEYSVNPNSLVAFDFSEKSRSRSLLGLTGEKQRSNTHHKPSVADALQPLTAVQVRQRLPEQAQLLQYAVLENKILMWLVSGTDIKTFEQRINAKDLRDKVSSYLHLLSSPPVNNEEEIESAATEFYDLLVKPVESLLDRNKELCIIPDKALNHLPFGALISRSSGNYLTQEYILTRAPSATIFIMSSENARDRGQGTSEKLLSVGNPRFDYSAFPTLDDLPASEREAVEIAELYSSSLITRERAFKSRVVSEMEKADVIHLALHAVINEHSPLRSKLLFARDSSSQGADTLELSEIYKLRLPQTRLVVLSACQSGAGRYYDGEGMIGISRPFIAKGVPLVVASLWPVDSSATAELMITFHKYRIENKRPTAAALTMAQRQMLSSQDKRYRHPYYWASFVTIGGYAPF